MLGVHYWIRYWRSYVWGTEFKVYTDHSPLRRIKTKKDITRRLTKMILELQEYSFQLLYIPGKLNVVSDAMTKGPFAKYIMACNAMIEEENIPVNQINATDIMIDAI